MKNALPLPRRRAEGEENKNEKMKKKVYFFSIPVLSILMLTGCHKTCTCIGYDGAERTYTADEVDEYGVTCPNMAYQAGVQYYSVCSWD